MRFIWSSTATLRTDSTQLDSDAHQGSPRVNQDSFRCERMLATVSASIAFDCGVDENINAQSLNGYPRRARTRLGMCLCTSSTHFSRVGRSYIDSGWRIAIWNIASDEKMHGEGRNNKRENRDEVPKLLPVVYSNINKDSGDLGEVIVVRLVDK